MIMIPGRNGRLVFAAAKDILAWRASSGAWIMFKPPWNRPLYSERNGLGGVRKLWSYKGWRLLRVKQ